MNSDAQQAALRQQLEQAQKRLEGLGQELRAVSTELEALSKERPHYDLLHDVCGGLEELATLGAAELFWGEHFADGEERLRHVREGVDRFRGQFEETEARRQNLAQRIRAEQDDAEFIEDDILEIQRREEERRLEWLVEREADDFPARPALMPWSRESEEDREFRRGVVLAILIGVFWGVLLPQINLPLPEPWELIEVPDRLAQLIEMEPLPPPPVQKHRPTEPEPSEKLVKPTPEAAPETAASSGLLAFRERFSGLAETQRSAKLGAEARIRSVGEAATGQRARAMVTTQAPGSSNGIDVGALSRDVGGAGESLEGISVARVTSSIDGIVGEERPMSNGAQLGRTDEEIQIVFDRHKAGLYRLYNRELRRDPTLRGQMVLRLRIEPDGSVSFCELHDSDMNAPQLSASVVARVRSFDFGAKEGIAPITILYPIDFLPAT